MLVDKFVRGRGTPRLSTVDDAHIIACTLKRCLSRLREPLIPFTSWSEFSISSSVCALHLSITASFL